MAKVSATTSPAWLRCCSGDSGESLHSSSSHPSLSFSPRRVASPLPHRSITPGSHGREGLHGREGRRGGRSSTTAPTPSRSAPSPLLPSWISSFPALHPSTQVLNQTRKIINLVFAAYAIMVEEDSVVHFYNCAINRFTLLEGCRG